MHIVVTEGDPAYVGGMGFYGRRRYDRIWASDHRRCSKGKHIKEAESVRKHEHNGILQKK